MADLTKVRLVRCPSCQTIIPELADYSLYKCGACGSVLSAKRKDHGSASLPEKKDVETDHYYKSGNPSERISKRREQQEHESQIGQEGSSEKREEMGVSWRKPLADIQEAAPEINQPSDSGFSIIKDTAETSSSKEIGHEKGIETEFLKIILESLPSDKTNILKQLKVTSSKLGDQSEASIKEGKDTQSSMPKVDIPVAKTDSFSQVSAMVDIPKIQIVQCPKCRKMLSEPVDCSVYKCGGCGVVLKGKKKVHGSVRLSEKGDVESDHAKSGNYLGRILIRREQQEHESEADMEKGGHETTSLSFSEFSSFKDTTTDSSLSEAEEIAYGEWMKTRFTEIPLDYSSSDTARILKLREGSSGMLSDQVFEADIPSTKQQKDKQSSLAKADNPIMTTAALLPLTDIPKARAPLEVETLCKEDVDDQLSSFEMLKVSIVLQLMRLPTNLNILKIEGCGSIEALPDDLLAGRTTLKELCLISCACLSSFPYPGSLTTLYIHKCRRLEFLPSLESRKKLVFLQNLCIGSSCDSLTTLTLDLFPKLKILCIWDCPNLQSVNVTREFKGDLASLESLEIRDCPRLRSLPDGGLHTPNLESILISNCKNLSALPDAMHFLTSLKTLFLHRCPDIESLPLGGLPSSLIVISIAYCDKLIPQEDWGLSSLESLHCFELEGGCMSMESFPDEFLLPCNINSLRISTLQSLKKLNHKGFQHLNALQTIEIHGCDVLQSLPDEGLPSSLSNLCVQECPLLTPRLKPKRGKEWHKVAHIPCLQIDHQLLSGH